MLEQTQKREAVDADQYHRRMLLALVLLLSAVIVMLAKDPTFWFGGDEASASDAMPNSVQSSTASVPNQTARAMPPASTPILKAKAERSAKAAAKPATGRAASGRAVLPSLQVEVVTGGTHRRLQPNMVQRQSNVVIASAVSQLGPATNAVQRTRLSTDQAQTPPPYPSLAGQTRVQGSVLLQALIGADGVIRELHVISGPAILSSAAREAAQQWRFKPYLQNGKAVATQARITVNFVINVWDNKARDHQDASKNDPLQASPHPVNPGN